MSLNPKRFLKIEKLFQHKYLTMFLAKGKIAREFIRVGRSPFRMEAHNGAQGHCTSSMSRDRLQTRLFLARRSR
jgi:hypothetical protein